MGAIVIVTDGTSGKQPFMLDLPYIMTQIAPALLSVEKNPWDRICIVVSKCNMDFLYVYCEREEFKSGIVKLMKDNFSSIECPWMDAFDPDRDIIFCGKKDKHPGYDDLLNRLSELPSDGAMPSTQREIIQKGINLALGSSVEGRRRV